MRHVYEWAGHCALKSYGTHVYLFYFFFPCDWGEWIQGQQSWGISLVLDMPNGTNCYFIFLYLETFQKVIKHQNMNSGLWRWRFCLDRKPKYMFYLNIFRVLCRGSIKPWPSNHHSDIVMFICICYLHMSPKSHTGWRTMKEKDLYTHKYAVGVYQILSQRNVRFLKEFIPPHGKSLGTTCKWKITTCQHLPKYSFGNTPGRKSLLMKETREEYGVLTDNGLE